MVINHKKWYINYIKHKDIFLKKIVSIKEKGDYLIVKYKDKVEKVLFLNEFHEFRMEENNKDENYSIVLPNKSNNIRELASNWDNVVRFKKLKIIFVNNDGKKWIVMPYIHDKIADKSHLEEGLFGLSESVNLV